MIAFKIVIRVREIPTALFEIVQYYGNPILIFRPFSAIFLFKERQISTYNDLAKC